MIHGYTKAQQAWRIRTTTATDTFGNARHYKWSTLVTTYLAGVLFPMTFAVQSHLSFTEPVSGLPYPNHQGFLRVILTGAIDCFQTS